MVEAMVEAFLKEWPDAEWGPAHIVLSDGNMADGHIDWCLSLCNAVLSHSVEGLDAEDIALLNKLGWYSDSPVDEIGATVAFLKTLRAIPEAEREDA